MLASPKFKDAFPASSLAALFAAYGDEELLRAETHHRLMNTFAILSSILRREARAAKPRGRVVLDRSAQIVMAHSDLHRCLIPPPGAHCIDAGDYVAELGLRLSEAVLEPLGLSCEVIVSPGLMEARRCGRLGLVICELVLNAAKHAFSPARPGLVRVELESEACGWCCRVSDNGSGIAEDMEGRGLGRQLIELLTMRLAGDLSRHSSPFGTVFTITIPPDGLA